jgi:tetratricopeptide (TPR) repeat protein
MPSGRHRRRGAARIALALTLAGVSAGCNALKARYRASGAAALYREGRLEEAAERYEQALALDPSIPELHLDLAFTCLSLFNASPKSVAGARWAARATWELRSYLATHPDDAQARSYLIQTFIDTRSYEEAKAFFRPDVERRPPNVEAIALLGQIAAKVGRLDDALDWYQKRVELAPSDPDGHEGLGVVIWDHLHNHPEVAGDARISLADRGIASVERAVALQPGASQPYVYVNLLYRERAAGHLCPAAADGGAPEGESGPADGGAATCEAARAADLAEAQRYYAIATEKARTPPAPEKR